MVDDEDWDDDEKFYEYEGDDEYRRNVSNIITDDKKTLFFSGYSKSFYYLLFTCRKLISEK